MAKKPHVPETTSGVFISLGIKDRLVIRDLFPQHGGYVEQLLAVDIGNKVTITQQEVKEYGIKDAQGGRVEWNPDTREKKFKFTEAEFSFLKSQVERLDNEKKITIDLVELCKKIKEAKGVKEDADSS